MSRHSYLIRWFLGFSALPALPACIAPEPPEAEPPAPLRTPSPTETWPETDLLADDDRVLPPEDWAPTARSAHRPGAARLCLLFDGADIDPDESFIVRRGQTTHVPAFDARSYGVADRRAAIEHVLDRVRRHFASTDLSVVEGDADADSCTRIAIGGRPTLVGESMAVAGIAPYDIGNRADDDIGFVFSGVLGAGRGTQDLDQLAAVVAHEAGHTFGLDHVRPPTDLMYPTVNDAMTAFTAAETLEGDWQDAPAMLRAALGDPRTGASGGATDAPLAQPDCDPPDDASGETREAARPLLPGRPATGHACENDEDWFMLGVGRRRRPGAHARLPGRGLGGAPRALSPARADTGRRRLRRGGQPPCDCGGRPGRALPPPDPQPRRLADSLRAPRRRHAGGVNDLRRPPGS
jgi:hypothetical protein